VLERVYQARLIKKLERRFPGCTILKNDPNHRQGILDLLILYRIHWAMLEVKASEHAPHQANQDYYVQLFNGMSFAAFIYPENEEEILSGLQDLFEPRWEARVS
jgi:hypothetical protein